MPRKNTCFAIATLSTSLVLSACSITQENKSEIAEAVQAYPTRAPAPTLAETGRLIETERQLTEKQRHCLEEKRRVELALKDSQKRNEEVQKKLDALLAIDREIRGRGKTH